MSYPRQLSTIERLESQSVLAIRRLRNEGDAAVQGMWNQAKDNMRSVIHGHYIRDFGAGTWTMPLVARRGTLMKIDAGIVPILSMFHNESMSLAGKYFKEIYKQTVLRHAYILDMVTPDSYKVHMPKNRMFEAQQIQTYQGPDADTAWKVRWSAWVDGYQSSLYHNLRMGAINDNTVSQAVNEIDTTSVGTPAADMSDAFGRIFLSQSVLVQSQAALDLAAENEEMGIEEIWQTSFGARVCDDCDSQQGNTKDDSEFDIPAHPNCECYWRLVPATYAALLRNGDADDIETAKMMDVNGIVPSAMVIRNPDGDPVGKAVVTFQKWVEGQSLAVYAS